MRASTVEYRREIYEITQILELGALLGRHLQTGKYETLDVAELNPVEQANNSDNNTEPQNETEADLGGISQEEKWDEALRRAEAVEYLLALPKMTVADVNEQAAKQKSARRRCIVISTNFWQSKKPPL